MTVTSVLASVAISEAVFHVRQYLVHCPYAKIAVIRLESYAGNNGGILFVKSITFGYFAYETFVASLLLVALIRIEQMPQHVRRLLVESLVLNR